jgi:mono/diheme cytochrome c family protein
MKTQSMLAFAALVAVVAFGLSARFVRAENANDPMLSPDALAKASGEEIYKHVCQGCHMLDGRGATGAGTYPALAENPHLVSARFTAVTVALGRHNMPHFAAQPELGGFELFVTLHLDDRQIAAVVNYVRSHFGNHYTDEVTAADIAALHR